MSQYKRLHDVLTRTVHRRQRVLDRPLSSSRLQRPEVRALFLEPRVFYSVAVEGSQTGRGVLLLLGAHPQMPGEISPQGGQEKVTLGLGGEELSGWRSLLRLREERWKRAGGGHPLRRSLGLRAIDVRRDAWLETVNLEKRKSEESQMKQECSKLISFLSDCQLSKQGRQRKQKTFKKLKKKRRRCQGESVLLCKFWDRQKHFTCSPSVWKNRNTVPK